MEAYSGRTCLYLGSVPPLSNPTPRSRFDSIDVWGLGGFVSFVVAGVGRLGHLLRGGWSHSPPAGKGGDVDDSVLCAGGGYVCVLVNSFVNFFCKNVWRDIMRQV